MLLFQIVLINMKKQKNEIKFLIDKMNESIDETVKTQKFLIISFSIAIGIWVIKLITILVKMFT